MSTLKWIGGGIALAFLSKLIFGSKTGSTSASTAGLPALKSFGVPWAEPTGIVWPVLKGDRSVSYTAPTGHVVGNAATCFHASRPATSKLAARWHAGDDLQCGPGQVVMAMEGGIVRGYAFGYVQAAAGGWLDAVVIEHPSVVAVYAEVKSAGLPVGSHVVAGQEIARGALNNDGRSMLHLELWQPGHAPKSFTPWFQSQPPPTGLFDPTRYLLALARSTS